MTHQNFTQLIVSNSTLFRHFIHPHHQLTYFINWLEVTKAKLILTQSYPQLHIMYQASNVHPQLESNLTSQDNYENNNKTYHFDDQRLANNPFQTRSSNTQQQQLDCHLARNNQELSPYNHNNNNIDTQLKFTFQEFDAIISGKDLDATTETVAESNEQNYDEADDEYMHQRGYQPLRYLDSTNKLEPTDNYYTFNCKQENIEEVEQQHNFDHFDGPNHKSFVMNNHRSMINNSFNNKNYQPINMIDNNKPKPFVEIVEQPAKCALRFRYKCEGRSAGSLPGLNSTMDNKTFPSIRLHNYVGRAVVVISCVTKDAPYRAHPHNIVGKEGCKKGICTIVINSSEPESIRSFSSLGIQCVKRKDIEESLTLRESINVDPFRNGFAHKSCGSNIDLNVVRLCFQVFIEGATANKCDVPLTPVVSDPIHDKKAMSDLVITKLSHCSAPATGGREVILLCDRISKDDIQLRFYEERNGKLVWESYTELTPNDVHKQVAICFKTPKYYNENITQPVMARIQLKRVSDNQLSEPRLFQFLPCESDEDIISRKRQKIEWVNMNHYALDNILQPNQHLREAQNQPDPHHHHHHNHHQHHHQHHHQQQQQANQPQHLHPSNNQQQMQMLRQQPDCSVIRVSPVPQLDHHHQQQQQKEFCDANQPVPTTSRLQRNSRSGQNSDTVQDQNVVMGQNANLVVRREIIDNDGKVMRLVDRTTQSPMLIDNNSPGKQQLASSLDRIDTAGLMRDMNFNSNMDFNLDSNLALQLQDVDVMPQLDQINQQNNHIHIQPSTSSSRHKNQSDNTENDNNC